MPDQITMTPDQVADSTVERAHQVAETIRPMLAGHGPDVQGAVLVQLVALHLAGHPPEMRSRLMALHITCVREMVPVVECELFGPAGHPARRDS